MAFGYILLKGRGGASGYIRENGGEREIAVRGIVPGTLCELYVAKNDDIRSQGVKEADGSGSASWTAPPAGRAFITAENKVLLWDGGDEAFLRAAAWLNSRREKSPEGKAPDPAADTAAEQASDTPLPGNKTTAFGRGAKRQEEPPLPFERFLSHAAAAEPEKESPPERAYTLRPAGKGEPADTLPERGMH